MNNWTDKVEVVKRLSVEQLRAAVKLINGDGHTIFDPGAFVRGCGWTPEDIAPFTQTYQSDGSAKGSISNRAGEIVDKMQGVYGLDLLENLADILKVKYVGAMGRGFKARNITDALLQHWK